MKSTMCNFSDLNPGDVFRMSGDDDFYMVCFVPGTLVPGSILYNTVNLRTGKLTFCSDIAVKRVDAVLHIKESK